MAGKVEGCCDIKRAVTSAGINCSDQKGGAYDLRIACKRYVSFSEYDCDGVDSEGGAASTDGDRRVYDVVTDDGLGNPIPQFFTVETRDKTLEYLWDKTFDVDAGTQTDTETFNFQVDVKSREFYCTVSDLIGQQVVALFREKSSDTWYMAGRYGGLVVTNINGGTGTTDFAPTTFVINGDDITDYFVEVFETDLTTTTTLIDGITSA